MLDLNGTTVTPPEPLADPEIPNLPCKVDDFGAYGIRTENELIDFWEACRPWLAKRGINLYELRCVDNYGPHRVQKKYWTYPATPISAALPFATLMDERPTNVQIATAVRPLFHAQDSMQRNVMLKLVENGSSEHLAYRRIMQIPMSQFTNSAEFPGVLPPLAILETPHHYVFIVMPMWGSPICIEDLTTLGEVLGFIECMLRGLSHLHDLRIAHRDICEYNIVVSCQSPGVMGDSYREALRKHRRSHEVWYALMDYDQSLLLPQDASVTTCRRPASETAAGAWLYKPGDVNLGEPYYNPFAHDVGMIGMMFRYYFNGAVVAVPGLAALFDGLTDHRVPHRLTAEEALSFFYTMKSDVPHDMLKLPIALEQSVEAMRTSETYWSKLSQEDQLSWGRFRTPSRPFWERVLDCITDIPIMWRFVAFVRRILGM
ncbi:hypothetical protein OH77DRAFT_1454160 [Trametes cingulata]|nr:hypothetical protein OH77DRAFT_1454160 [Trametes cingulata]